jgi:iron-sulfur cluster assembly protein
MLNVSAKAAERIQEVVESHPGQYRGLRVGLQDGGCSGYSYLLAFEGAPDEDDLVIEQGNARVFVHPLHVPYLAGSVLDWEDGGVQSGFKLENPNVRRMCGCGESFDV